MKNLKIIIIAIFFTFIMSLVVCASDNIKLYVNGNALNQDVNPVIVNGRTLVPARGVFEKLGASVQWIDSRKQVVVISPAAKVVLNIGSKTAYINNNPVQMETQPVIINSRTLIPVRFVAENLGYDVLWNESERAVYISGAGNVYIPPEVCGVDYSVNGDTTVVNIMLTNMIKPDISYLPEPERFVADFYGASLKIADVRKTVNSSSVKEIRYASHPEYSRIVIESPAKVSYKVAYNGNIMSVTLTYGDTSEGIEYLTAPPSQNTSPVGNILVALDAGHGGKDCGAVGRDEYDNPLVYESNVNLKVAQAVKKYLNQQGIPVIMTRTDDVALGGTEMEDLLERSRIANESAATLFVSIHSNAFSRSDANGTEILYADNEDKVYCGFTSKQLAQNILTPLLQANGLTDRGVKDSPKIVVLRTTTMPSVLIETAFVTSPKDRAVLMNDNLLDAMGSAIANGIIATIQ